MMLKRPWLDPLLISLLLAPIASIFVLGCGSSDSDSAPEVGRGGSGDGTSGTGGSARGGAGNSGSGGSPAGTAGNDASAGERSGGNDGGNDGGGNGGNTDGEGTSGHDHGGTSGSDDAGGAAGHDHGGTGGSDDGGSGGGDGSVVNDEPPERVSAGLAHSCAVTGEGRIYCWGDAANGRLGNNETAGELTTPEAVLEPKGADPASDWAQVSAGHSHTCGLKTDGRLFCWGQADNGLLGNAAIAGTFATPVAVLEPGGKAAASDWSMVAAGGNLTCALKQDGRAFCWGNNAAGQLGNDGEGTDSATPVAVLDPAAAPAKSDWLNISTGDFHACGVKKDGRALCWGHGGASQLGTGSNSNADTPSLVPEVNGADPAADWAHVSAGPRHSCGRKTDGRLLCWGTNSAGQLGNLPQSAGATPLPVREPGGGAPAGGWVQVTTGYGNSCGLKPDGRLYCWGSGGYGSNGNDDPKSYASPRAVLEPGAGEAAADWAAVSGGHWFACALKTDDKVLCWGKGDNGQLGNGDDQHADVPVAVLVPAAQLSDL